MKYILLIICLLLGADVGHTQDKGNAKKIAKPKATDACCPEKTAPANGPQKTEPGPNFSGKVTETMNTAGYTYVLIDTGKQQVWAAAVQFNVKTGDTVAIAGGMPMKNYHSKTLDRDFDLVYFASNVDVNGKSLNANPAVDLPTGHPPIAGAKSPLPEGHPPTGATSGSRKVDVSDVVKLAGGKSVAEIHAGKMKLKGKPIAVRGKVVKYNSGILGKNWLHIQDGTGPAGSESLVVTTDAEAKIGDTVVVKGNVSTDRDFGYGYKYGLIVENAAVTVE